MLPAKNNFFLSLKNCIFKKITASPDMHPDNKYIEAIKNNATQLIEEMYFNHAPKIERMVLQNNGSTDDAADIFQEAMIDLYHKAHTGFILTCPLDAFLYVICKNRWISRLNKKQRSGVTFMDTDGYNNMGEDVFKNSETLQLQDAKKKLLDSKFTALGDSCKELLGFCISGKGLAEIANLMNTTYGYIRKKKSDCMGKLVALVKTSPEYKLLLG